MYLKKQLAAGIGLMLALAIGLTAGGWARDEHRNLQKRIKEVIEKIPKDPDILINVEPEEVPGTPELTKLGRLATPALRSGLLGNINDSVRARCGWMLAILRDSSALPDLIQALKDRSDEVRMAALDAIGALSATEPLPAILALLSDRESSDTIRASALRTLGAIGDSRALKDIERYIAEEQPFELQSAALSALWTMRNNVSTGVLESHFRAVFQFENPEPLLAQMVVPWLGKMHSRAAIGDLIDLFAKADRGLKNRIIIALGEIGDNRAAAFLSEYLTRAQDGRLLNNAAIALSKVGGKAKAIEQLKHLMQDPKAYIRVNAAFALGEIGDKTAFDVLTAALNDKNDLVRSEVCVALGRTGDATVTSALEKAAEDWNRYVRRDAIVALNRIDFAKYRNLLVDKLLKDKVEKIRTRAFQFLAEKRDPLVLDMLMGNLRTAGSQAKLEAVKALVDMDKVKTEQLVPALLYQLVENYSTELRRSVLQAIRQKQIAEAGNMLVELIYHSYGEHLHRVLFTIGQLKVANILAQLPQLAQMEDRHDRLYLAYARAMHGDSEAVETLVDGLMNGTVSEKRDAGFLLGRLDQQSVVARLQQLDSHPDPLVAMHAAHALMPRDVEGKLNKLYDLLASARPALADEAQRILAKAAQSEVDAYLERRLNSEKRWFVRERLASIHEQREDKEFR